MESNWWTSLLCLGSVCVGPALIFGLGVMVGQGRLHVPYRLVRVRKEDYAVED